MPAPDSVDVFWATPRPPATLDTLLVDSDRHHLDWLRSDAAREESATARALLRAVLAARFGVSPEAIEISRACPECTRSHGRPTVANLPVHVSASHSDQRVVVAVTGIAPVGVDVEWVIPQRMAGVGLTTAEWTRREAWFKATGGVGAFDPQTVLASGGRHVDVGRGYQAAVYLEGDIRPPITVTAADDLLSAWAASPRTTTA